MSWEEDATQFTGGGAAASNADGMGKSSAEDLADRTAKVSAHLKQIYRKAVLPVEKRFRYDYFYESPFLTDVEFDCELIFLYIRTMFFIIVECG